MLESADRAKVDKYLRTLTEQPARGGGTRHGLRVQDRHEQPEYGWTTWGSLIPSWTFDEGPAQLGKQFASLLIPTIDSVRCEYNIACRSRASAASSWWVVRVPPRPRSSCRCSTRQPAHAHLQEDVLLAGDHALHLSAADRVVGREAPGQDLWAAQQQEDVLLHRRHLDAAHQRLGRPDHARDHPPDGRGAGFYNLDKPGEFKGIVDVLILGAMLHPGAGKNDIPNRAKRHFHVMNVTLPSTASINQIFGAMGQSFFSHSADAAIKEMSQELVAMTISIWDRVKTKLLPTPAKFHYLFNLRDLSRVFQGIFAIDVTTTLDSSFTLLALWKHECDARLLGQARRPQGQDVVRQGNLRRARAVFRQVWRRHREAQGAGADLLCRLHARRRRGPRDRRAARRRPRSTSRCRPRSSTTRAPRANSTWRNSTRRTSCCAWSSSSSTTLWST